MGHHGKGGQAETHLGSEHGGQSQGWLEGPQQPPVHVMNQAQVAIMRSIQEQEEMVTQSRLETGTSTL